ncbi:hypothetical protein E2C01_083678 [Portunus trituberculatus]|uniref:Uncharacterized protein n=1 Tax=Portunus trituberculatus TaxID=210409 RepID=A0A5B7J770_PORTR|nr:hypothetical protein [Portunus trituberculatus]
MATCSTSLAW